MIIIMKIRVDFGGKIQTQQNLRIIQKPEEINIKFTVDISLSKKKKELIKTEI